MSKVSRKINLILNNNAVFPVDNEINPSIKNELFCKHQKNISNNKNNNCSKNTKSCKSFNYFSKCSLRKNNQIDKIISNANEIGMKKNYQKENDILFNKNFSRKSLITELNNNQVKGKNSERVKLFTLSNTNDINNQFNFNGNLYANKIKDSNKKQLKLYKEIYSFQQEIYRTIPNSPNKNKDDFLKISRHNSDKNIIALNQFIGPQHINKSYTNLTSHLFTCDKNEILSFSPISYKKNNDLIFSKPSFSRNNSHKKTNILSINNNDDDFSILCKKKTINSNKSCSIDHLYRNKEVLESKKTKLNLSTSNNNQSLINDMLLNNKNNDGFLSDNNSSIYKNNNSINNISNYNFNNSVVKDINIFNLSINKKRIDSLKGKSSFKLFIE